MSRRAFASLLFAAAASATIAPPAVAQDKRFGEWSVGAFSSGDGVYAVTMNDSKALFGQSCFPETGKCLWVLANDIDCDEGARYPVLVNADTGASTQQILCQTVNGKTRYAISDFEAIDGIVRKSTRLGLAFPMRDGRFQVTRFSLDGAVGALGFMRGAAEAAARRPVRATTRDQML